MRVVTKFGGTSLQDGRRIEKAADSIESLLEDGHQPIAVVSAMGDTTDQLLNEITFQTREQDEDEIVSMGERISARMLKANLEGRGIKTKVYEPGNENWPIITKEGDVLEEKTERNVQSMKNGLEDKVPVVTGFLAEDLEGDTTTLGRGGSDTTAVMLGNYLDADKTIIVTDVEGVLTGNPSITESTHNVGEISVDELRDLSFKGAEVVSPESLAYKQEEMDVSVVHYQEEDLLESGTSIKGEFNQIIKMEEKRLSCVTVAGREINKTPGIIGKLSSDLKKEEINIQAISTGVDCVSFFIHQEDTEAAGEPLHNNVVEDENLSSVTVDEDIAAIRVIVGELPDRPGLIQDIIDPLAEQNINIHEIVSSASTITVFTTFEVRQQALNGLQNNLGDQNGED